MKNLQSYMKKVSKDYAYRVHMGSTKPAVLERKLADLGVSSVIAESKDEYVINLNYPVQGKDLLARLCEGTKGLIRVYDSTGEVYSNQPIEVAKIEESVEESESVIEIKKAGLVQETKAEPPVDMIAVINEHVSQQLESVVARLLENQQPITLDQKPTIDAVVALSHAVTEMKESLSRLQDDIAGIHAAVGDAMGSYNKKLIELTEANNKLNHKVKKTVVRDANGFITEVTEQIIPEK